MIILLVLFLLSLGLAGSWDSVDKVLTDALTQKVFPGAAALVYGEEGILYRKFFGKFEYDESSPEVGEDSIFDLASLTKVLSTTTVAEQFFGRGELPLEMKVSSIFKEFAQEGKENITVYNLLVHDAGFPPDPTPLWYHKKEFGCPESEKSHPQLAFNCVEKVKQAWLSQSLDHPPGEKFVYSDLSMISMHFVLGHLAKSLGYVQAADILPGCPHSSETCFYEAYARKHVFEALGLQNTKFVPTGKMKANCLPTWIDDYYRNRLIEGEVCDENAYAQGGVSGHAGLFSNLDGVAMILKDVMFDHKIVDDAVVSKFIKVQDLKMSSRALGWGTNYYQDYICKPWAKETFYHTGYTGTAVCGDPIKKVFTILLTNRCHPDKTGKMPEINTVRTEFNQAVYDVLYPSKVV